MSSSISAKIYERSNNYLIKKGIEKERNIRILKSLK